MDICFRPISNYFICNTVLPDTPEWKGTLWEECLNNSYRNDFSFIVTEDRIVYKINSEDSVENVSKLMSWGEVEAFGMNNKTRPIFRAAWVKNNIDQYIQYFSPVAHGIEMFSILDGFGSNGKTTLPLLPFPMLKTTNDEFIPYTLSLEDIMATDWIIHGYTLEETRDQILKELFSSGCSVLDMNEVLPEDIQEELKEPEKEILKLEWSKIGCNCVSSTFGVEEKEIRIEVFSGVSEEHEIPEYIVDVFEDKCPQPFYSFSFFFEKIEEYEHYGVGYFIEYIQQKLLNNKKIVEINFTEESFKKIINSKEEE